MIYWARFMFGLTITFFTIVLLVVLGFAFIWTVQHNYWFELALIVIVSFAYPVGKRALP